LDSFVQTLPGDTGGRPVRRISLPISNRRFLHEGKAEDAFPLTFLYEVPVDAGIYEEPWPCTDPKVKSFADADSGVRMQANALRP